MSEENSQNQSEIITRISELQNERDAVSNAILIALGQPVSVNIVGSVAYTNRSLTELYKIRNNIDITLAAFRNGSSVFRTFPKYWRQNGSQYYPVAH